MRTPSTEVLYFDFSGQSSVKVAKEYRAKYAAISYVLEANRQLLDLAHQDGVRWLSTSARGRGWVYLRAVVAGVDRDVCRRRQLSGCDCPY